MPATILYGDSATAAASAHPEGDDLWLGPADLKAATGWELKPEGMCRDDICIPVPEAQAASMLRRGQTETWVNLAGFARYMDQAVAHADEQAVWYFGPAGQEQAAQLLSLEAPDFTLPAYDGATYSLSEFRGKKVLLLLWSSW